MKNIIVIDSSNQVINVAVFSDTATEELMQLIYPGCSFVDTASVAAGVFYDIGTYYNPADKLFYVDSGFTIIATPPTDEDAI